MVNVCDVDILFAPCLCERDFFFLVVVVVSIQGTNRAEEEGAEAAQELTVLCPPLSNVEGWRISITPHTRARTHSVSWLSVLLFFLMNSEALLSG